MPSSVAAAAKLPGVPFLGLSSCLGTAVRGLPFGQARSLSALALAGIGVADLGRAPLVYAYNPSRCGFERTPADEPRQSFIAGMECWATDLLAVLSGELGVIALLFGRAGVWNTLPGRFNFDIFGELHRISHPLRRPAEYLRIYERLLGDLSPQSPSVLHRSS